ASTRCCRSCRCRRAGGWRRWRSARRAPPTPGCWRSPSSRRRVRSSARSSRRIETRTPPTCGAKSCDVSASAIPNPQSAMIPPGSTIGVLGGGQLGRMFAMAARRLGYRVHTLAPDHDTPTGQIADEEVNASYDDLDAIAAFARRVDVVTFEFENVSAAAVVEAERHAIVRPNGRALAITQHRIREKTFLASHGLPVTPFAAVRTDADFAQ